MNPTLAALDREWAELNASPAANQALENWRCCEPALDGLVSVSALLAKRRADAEAAPAILAALARLAADDQIAARTLLQALLPGLVRLASGWAGDDPAAVDELVALAWQRIRTYPTSRPGSVAANVLWDVRKRYREHRAIEAPESIAYGLRPPADQAPSAEEIVVGRSAVDDVVAARRDGVISGVALSLILRTRLDDAPLEVAAAEQRETACQANCIRWRAECRLRPVLAMAG